ncbi:MAG TPA: MBL fold metallo-hydrolase [Vicinamibacterales bacterium]|nr:MBL fold metallo-hydrolase [Vicinamibacterales bacterium]
MRRTLISTLVVALAGCSSTPKTAEQQFLDDTMTAIGGRANIDALRSIVIEGTGVNYNLGQDMKPEAATQTFELTGYKRQIDIASNRQLIEQVRTPKFTYFQGPQPQKQVQALEGEVAFNVSESGQSSRLQAWAERDRRSEFLHHPATALKVAASPGVSIANVRTTGAVRQADFTLGDRTWTLTIDAGGLPLSVSHRSYHANLGDVVITTTFANYQEVSGLKLPTHLVTKVDDFTTAEIRVTTQAINTPFTAPEGVNAAAVKPAVTPTPNVTAERVGTGVWLLAGQSHHSVLVEFADHLMLIDAPQSEARTLAVIAKAKDTVKNKPLTQLVTTHHHFDHTAGLRAAIAEGMSVFTHAGNKEWVENMARRPHTLAPDALTKSATRLVVETVDDEREVKDASQTVMLYHVAGNPHSDTMLMAYIPRDRLIIEVDAFSPGSAVQPYAPNLLENIQKRSLRVDKIVPLHGAIAPFSELVKVGGAK